METIESQKQAVTEIKVPTGGGHAVKGLHYIPAASMGRVIVISSATGVKQDFYRHFAEFLAKHGFHVYTYDYCGIGRSRPESLRGCDVNMAQWGEIDLAAMIRYVRQRHPGYKMTLLGHSIGGQLIGITPESASADALVMIGAQTPYWQHYEGFTRIKVWLLWYVLIPVLSTLCGYFPAGRLGLFEDLPSEVARQWARWGKSRHYMFHEYPSKRRSFSALHQRALVISFSDDSFAPRRAVDDLLQYYANLDVKYVHYRPSDVNLRSIGHFRFFRKESESIFWNQVLQFATSTAKAA